MKKIKTYMIMVGIACMISTAACRKDFLDAKPNSTLVVPTSLEDFQLILDNVKYMNGSMPGTLGISGANGGPNPMLLEVATDNYYIPDNFLSTFEQFYRNVYTWSKEDTYGGISSFGDWAFPYRAVFYANVVLDGLREQKRTEQNQMDWDRIKGSALFYRAYSFYQLAQVFAPVYEQGSAKNQLGIPLRQTADISEKSVRANLEETYNRIIDDLLEAVAMLPNIPEYKTRPSIPAAYALLARVHLSKSDYIKAKIYAQKCLEAYKKPLINYNTINSAAQYPFTRFNDEVIFSSIINNKPSINLYYVEYARIDSNLYKSYDDNDLRKMLFFQLREPKAYSFKGSYDGASYPFVGIALDEVYLILSESLIRTNDIGKGLKYLNDLLASRYSVSNGQSTFSPYNTTDGEEALRLVLTERRKELIMRGLRLTDLRRLNKDSRFAQSIYRKVNGQQIELPANDLRYTWPIPNDVIALTGMAQNPR